MSKKRSLASFFVLTLFISFLSYFNSKGEEIESLLFSGSITKVSGFNLRKKVRSLMVTLHSILFGLLHSGCSSLSYVVL